MYDVDPVDGAQAWALFEACRDGDEDTVRGLLADAPNLVHAQYWYTQPIHFAVYGNRPRVVRTLLDAGAEPGRTRFMDSGWSKLLRLSSAYGFDEVHDMLAQAVRARFGYAPGFERVKRAIVSRERGRIEAVLGQAPGLARASDAEGRNAVHWAVTTRQPELVPLFCALGADPAHRRSDGQAPAHVLFNGDYEYRVWRELEGVAHADEIATLGALLDAGASADLSVACATGDIGLARELLANQPGLARRLDSGRRSPLGYAARSGHEELVRLVLGEGADPNQPEELAPRGHALWYACARSRVSIAEALLDHGADPNSAPDSSDSCLGIARSRQGKAARRIEELLLAHGAETPPWHMTRDELRDALAEGAPVCRKPWFAEEALARNDLGLARLLLEKDPEAARRLNAATLRMGDPDMAIASAEVIKLLLAAGFDPDRRGWLGQTALHHYAGRGETAAVKLALDHGADPNVLDDERHGTPLAWAASAGHLDAARLLVDRGADPSLPRCIPAATPLERARAAGHDDMAAWLEEATRRPGTPAADRDAPSGSGGRPRSRGTPAHDRDAPTLPPLEARPPTR